MRIESGVKGSLGRRVMTRQGPVGLAVLAAITLYSRPTIALPPPLVPTTHARLTIAGGASVLVTYMGGLGSFNAVALTAPGKTGIPGKAPGKLDFPTLSVSRPRVDTTLLVWREDVVTGHAGFKHNVTFDFLDLDGVVESSFSLTNAWPSQYSVSALPAVQFSGKTSSQEGETLVLAYEDIART